MTTHNSHSDKTSLVADGEPRRLSQLFGFRTRLYLTWAVLLGLCVMFFLSFDLKLSIILDKLPNLVGVHLGPSGFLQGAALTLFLCFCSIWFSLLLGFVTALARLSRSAVAFGIATFYASFFRGTPLLIQILLIYLGLPRLALFRVQSAQASLPCRLTTVPTSARFPSGHLGCRPRTTPSSDGVGAFADSNLCACHPATSHAHHYSADNQPVYFDAQRLIFDFGHGRVGGDVSCAVLWAFVLSLY